MGNSDSLADPVKFRFLIFTGCPPNEHRQGSPVFIVVWLPLRVTLVTPGAHLSVTAVIVRIDAPVFPYVREGRHTSIVNFEATSRFACAATRRFAQLPLGAFVRKLSASGYPLHLPQATWANYRTPTIGL